MGDAALPRRRAVELKQYSSAPSPEIAQATRAFRAGSYTDASAADETTKALQAIVKSLTSKEDSLAQDRRKLASIGRLEERVVFLLRGCDTLKITLCPGVVGKELFHALRIAGTQARPTAQEDRVPLQYPESAQLWFRRRAAGSEDPRHTARVLPLSGRLSVDVRGATEERLT